MLEKLIRRLSANGPVRYRDEQSMLDVLDGALVNEEWADAVKAARESDDSKPLKAYMNELIAFMRTHVASHPTFWTGKPSPIAQGER